MNFVSHRVLGFLPVAAALFLAACKEHTKEAPPVPTVLVAEVGVQDVPVLRSWVGSLSGAQNTTVEARVSGYLLSQDYAEGSLVQAGQVLFRIDPRPYQAALAQAEADLAQAAAKAELAKITLERQTELFKTQVISAQEFDVATQTAQADIAAVKAAEANVETAQLNLEFCTIIAPFDGIAGKAEAQVGDLVGSAAGTVLTTVSQIQPIKVNFFLSEQDYITAKPKLEAFLETPLEQRIRNLRIFLANGELYPQSGVVDFLNRQVDPRTGTIEVVGLFPNPQNLLRPGQFARVQVEVKILENAIVVPQRAVSELQGTYYQVAVVNEDNTVKIQTVEVGERYQDLWVISSGLEKGDRIVVEGGQKLQNGIKVNPKPYVPAPTPTPSPTPTPAPIPAVEQIQGQPPVPGTPEAEAQAIHAVGGGASSTPAPAPPAQQNPSPAPAASPN